MAITDNDNCIKNGLRADIMRSSMENKNLLKTKGSIYIGSGSSITKGDESIARTEALNPGEAGDILMVGGDKGIQYSKLKDENFTENTYNIKVENARNADSAMNALNAAEAEYASGNKTATIDSRIESLKSQIGSLASGSPKGVYTDVNALQTAIPDGDENIYVCSDTGHWYYWSGSSWVDGGVYQATNIEDGSIDEHKLSSNIIKCDFEKINMAEIPNVIKIENRNMSVTTSGIKISVNSGYDCYYFLPNNDIKIYVENITAEYYGIGYCEDYTGFYGTESNPEMLYGSNAVRLKNTDNNLPTKDNPLMVSKNGAIVICVPSGVTDNIYMNTSIILSDDVRLSQSHIEQITKLIVNPLQKSYSKNNIALVPNIKKLACKNVSFTDTGLKLTSHDGYDCYYVLINKDTNVYAQNISTYYYCIAYCDNFTGYIGSEETPTGFYGSNANRLRNTDNNLPTKDNPLLIKENGVMVICVPHDEIDNIYIDNTYSFNENVTLTHNQVNQVLNSNRVNISKASDTLYNINLGNYTTKLQKVVNTSINSNLWNLLGIFKNGNQLITGDIIGPIQEYGEADFMGGVHGDEENLLCMISCDGVLYDGSTEKTCDEIKIILKSKLFRVSTKEYIFDRFVTIVITHNKIEITNLHKCLVDNFILTTATSGGLFGIVNTYLKAISITNYAIGSAPTQSPQGITSKDNISATAYLEDGSITVNNIIGHELDTYVGYIHVFTDETPIRTKIYLDLVHSGQKIMNSGDTLLGKFEYVFK